MSHLIAFILFFFFFFFVILSNECDNQLYIVMVHLILLHQSRFSVLLSLSNDSSHLFSFFFESAYLLYIRTQTVLLWLLSATKLLSVAPLLHAFLSSVCSCTPWDRLPVGPGIVGPLGFDRIISFFGIPFIFGTLRAKGTGSSLALALHYHEALSVPCASSPGSCSEESDSGARPCWWGRLPVGSLLCVS